MANERVRESRRYSRARGVVGMSADESVSVSRSSGKIIMYTPYNVIRRVRGRARRAGDVVVRRFSRIGREFKTHIFGPLPRGGPVPNDISKIPFYRVRRIVIFYMRAYRRAEHTKYGS